MPASPKKAKKKAEKTAKKKVPGKSPPNKTRKTVKKAATRKKTSHKDGRKRPPARRTSPSEQSAADQPDQTVHCTLAATGQWSMVLPTSAIAEITDYAPPAPLDNTPEWLLGQVEWEDWQVPVISYGALIDGDSPESATAQSHIMVVKSLSSAARVPFIGILVSEIPRLTNLSPAEMQVTEDEGKSPGVHCTVKLGSQKAVIPDLDKLGQLVGHAAYGVSAT